jgi:hypothetical protein
VRARLHTFHWYIEPHCIETPWLLVVLVQLQCCMELPSLPLLLLMLLLCLRVRSACRSGLCSTSQLWAAPDVP